MLTWCYNLQLLHLHREDSLDKNCIGSEIVIMAKNFQDDTVETISRSHLSRALVKGSQCCEMGDDLVIQEVRSPGRYQ